MIVSRLKTFKFANYITVSKRLHDRIISFSAYHPTLSLQHRESGSITIFTRRVEGFVYKNCLKVSLPNGGEFWICSRVVDALQNGSLVMDDRYSIREPLLKESYMFMYGVIGSYW